jgi:hypothetical protein
VNARRLRRLHADWPLGVVALLIQGLAMWWWLRGGGSRWLSARLGIDTAFVLLQVTGLAFFGLVYAWHYPYYRNMGFLGLKPPSGLTIGIIAVAAAIAADAALFGALHE